MISRTFTTGQFYRHLTRSFRAMPHMLRPVSRGGISKQLSEKLMLAVTRVNGCRYCSWFHTGQALKTGMDKGEVLNLLKGEMGDLHSDEVSAILYAQHYADTDARPDPATHEKLLKEYGRQKTLSMEASIKAITVGNIYGIAFDGFTRRFRGKHMEGSQLQHELGILMGTLLFWPVALIHSLFLPISS